MDMAAKTPGQKLAAAKRTAWILAAIAAAFFILSIIDQFVAVHHH